MSKNNRVFTHPHPIKESEIDSTVLVPVIESVYSDEYDYEEIPSVVVNRNHYRLLSSPLIVRDLNLDDVVMMDDNGLFLSRVKDRGKFGFRVGMQVHYDDHDEELKYDNVIKKLEKLHCDIELYSHHLVGIVANSRWKARKVQRELLKLVDEGLIIGVETNRS